MYQLWITENHCDFFQKYITLSLRLPWASQPGDRGNRSWWSHGEYNRLNRRSNTSCRRKQWGNKPSSAAWPRERRISGTSIPKRSENEGERIEVSDVQGAVDGYYSEKSVGKWKNWFKEMRKSYNVEGGGLRWGSLLNSAKNHRNSWPRSAGWPGAKRRHRWPWFPPFCWCCDDPLFARLSGEAWRMKTFFSLRLHMNNSHIFLYINLY